MLKRSSVGIGLFIMAQLSCVAAERISWQPLTWITPLHYEVFRNGRLVGQVAPESSFFEDLDPQSPSLFHYRVYAITPSGGRLLVGAFAAQPVPAAKKIPPPLAIREIVDRQEGLPLIAPDCPPPRTSSMRMDVRHIE